ncbi:MAG: hypothetical protein ACOYJ1_16650 [Peptococcales bacterium]
MLFDWVLTTGLLFILIWFIVVVYNDLADKEGESAYKYILVIVKNQENAIENIVRRALILQRRFITNSQLIFVDLASQDRTSEIILKMAYPENYFSLLNLKNHEEFEKLLDEYEKESLILDYTVLNMKNPGGP